MSESIKNIEKKHISVLYEELVWAFEMKKTEKNIIVDCTLWMWWHAKGIIDKMNIWDVFIGFDADKRNLVLARQRLLDIDNTIEVDNFEKIVDNKKNLIFINSNFWNLAWELEKAWIKEITGIYYDLGISSVHIDQKDRWFSFRFDGPLDMRFDTKSFLTAKKVVNSYDKQDLYEIFKNYWEEPASRKIAEAIYRQRKIKKFETTGDLLNLIEQNSRHPKTKTRIFQALRIEVNKELDNLEKSLNSAIRFLKKDSIIFVISFHSLEDRITKQIFKRETRDCICKDLICSCNHKKSLQILTKKPIVPTDNEIQYNPRARSAKARIAKKIV